MRLDSLFRVVLFLGGFFVAILPGSRADTIANQQTTRTSPEGYTLWASETYPDAPNYARSFDQFTALSDTAIGTVQWEGAYINQADPAANPPRPNTTTFEISLYSDNGGQPGQKLASAIVDLADLSPKALGLLPYAFSATLTVQAAAYGYSASLPSPFPVNAGQTYWLSIVSNSTSQEPTWGWMSGKGADSRTVQDFAGQRFQRQQDRTFKLASAPGQILTDVNGRAFAAGASLPVSATFENPGGADSIEEVDFLADGEVFASLDGNGNPRSAGQKPTARESSGAPAAGAVFQATYTLPGTNRLVSIVAHALTKLGQTKTSPAVSVQSVSATTDRPPQVAISQPAPVRVGEAVSVPVAVSDPDAGIPAARRRPHTRDFGAPSGVIQKIEYYLNALKVKDSAEAPFSFDFTPGKAGTYVLTAIATDGSGLATASAPVRLEALGPPEVSVGVGAPAVTEGSAGSKFLISRSGTDFTADLTVFYKTIGSAKSGADYKELPGTVVIPAGAASAKVKLKPTDDGTANGTRTVKLKLSASKDGSYTVGSPKKATISILDND